jgi:hypothetical protein
MWRGTQGTDYNGIVVFDPDALRAWCGGNIAPGTDLFHRFTASDEGDRVLELGIVVPILAIDDGGYTIIVREAGEPSPVSPWIVVENAVFPLRITRDAVLADLAVLREWHDELGWQRVPIAAGSYAVTVRGFCRRVHGRIADAGYELELARVTELPAVTGATGKPMRVWGL